MRRLRVGTGGPGEAKASLVRLRGRWVEVNAREIQAALDYWRKQANQGVTARQMVAVGPGSIQAAGGHTAGRGLGHRLDGRAA